MSAVEITRKRSKDAVPNVICNLLYGYRLGYTETFGN